MMYVPKVCKVHLLVAIQSITTGSNKYYYQQAIVLG